LAQLESRSVDETFLTVAEIAEQLRLNQQTVRNWIDRGELPAIHVGRSVRIRAGEFEQFIAASSSARRPKETAAREEFDAALTAVQANTDAAELPAALRRLAVAANALARALPGS
jgi:excisionase family DNA binding protein